MRQQGFQGQIAVADDGQREADTLRHAGADLVLVPYFGAAREAAGYLLSAAMEGWPDSVGGLTGALT